MYILYSTHMHFHRIPPVGLSFLWIPPTIINIGSKWESEWERERLRGVSVASKPCLTIVSQKRNRAKSLLKRWWAVKRVLLPSRLFNHSEMQALLMKPGTAWNETRKDKSVRPNRLCCTKLSLWKDLHEAFLTYNVLITSTRTVN